MITLFSGLILVVGLYILVVFSAFFGIVLQDLMNFASKINDINRCFICGCETADENCCRITGLAGRHKLIVPKPCNYHMHPVSSFCPVSTGMNANFIQYVKGIVFAKRLSARTEGIIHFGKIKCAWRWAVGLQRERAHDGQETCPEYSIGTGGVQWQWLSRGSSNEGASWVCCCFLPLFFFGHR